VQRFADVRPHAETSGHRHDYSDFRLGLSLHIFHCGIPIIAVPYSLSFQLTPSSKVLLENLTGSQLFLKFPAFYGNFKFISAFTSARHLSISCARSIHFMPLPYFLKIHLNIIPNLRCARSIQLMPLPHFLKIHFNIILQSTLCQINPVNAPTLLLEDPF